MIDAKTLAVYPNALAISVHGEKSSAGHNWYTLHDWTPFPIGDPGTLPKEIQDGFASLEEQNLVGALATSNAGIRLYLINISALNNRRHPPSGKPGPSITGFTTTLDQQTILLRGSRHGSTDILYSRITQANWKRNALLPKNFGDGVPEQIDSLITNSNLAVQYDPPDPSDTTVISCYLLNLVHFTDP